MACLVATLGSDKNNWEHVNRLILSRQFSHIYLIADSYADANYKEPVAAKDIKMSLLALEFSGAMTGSITALTSYLKDRFREDKIIELDIALNMSSGDGRLHAAALSAIMKLGYGIRLVDLDNAGQVIEL